jgi:hypothetical protein
LSMRYGTQPPCSIPAPVSMGWIKGWKGEHRGARYPPLLQPLSSLTRAQRPRRHPALPPRPSPPSSPRTRRRTQMCASQNKYRMRTGRSEPFCILDYDSEDP